jgi:hypothetical protein
LGVGAGRGGWGAGLRFVPPKAEAERQGLLLMRRSKKRASEQREDFFGHRKAARSAIVRWLDGNPGRRERAWETCFSGENSQRMGWKMWKTDGKGRVLGHLCGEKRPLTVENCVKSGENLYRMGGFIECKIMRSAARPQKPPAGKASGRLVFLGGFPGRSVFL